MPTFNIRLVVNVPSIGDRTIDQPGIVAASMEEAIKQAKANILMRPTLVTETAS